MIQITCDRCGTEMPAGGLIGYISWCFKEGVDGDLEENELEGMHFCERCMDEIRATINKPVSWGKKKYETPEIIEEAKKRPRISKEQGKKIMNLKAEGKTIKEIAEETGLGPVQVRNWLYNHKEKE